MNNCPFLINLQSVKFIFTTLHFKNNEKFKKTETQIRNYIDFIKYLCYIIST